MKGTKIKKSSAIRALHSKASKADIAALLQLSTYYYEGKRVEQNDILASHYYEEALDIFQSHCLRVSSVRLINFRIFKDAELELSRKNNLTVIVGANGAGKTTVLDALNKSMSWLSKRIVSENGVGESVEEGDICNDKDCVYGEIITRIKVTDTLRSEISLSRVKDGFSGSWKSKLYEFKKIGDLYRQANTRYEGFNFPILAYYSVERALDINPKDIDKFYEITEELSWGKTEGYSKSLNGTADFKLFFRWYKYLEEIDNSSLKDNYEYIGELEALKSELKGGLLVEMEKKALTDDSFADYLRKYKQEIKGKITTLEVRLNTVINSASGKLLDCVKDAIYSFMPEFSNLRIIRHPSLGMLIDKGEVTLSVLQLSQGEKSLMAMVADIARRLVLLNPSLDNPLCGSGVVLIDELDLHLHPKWQQKVVPSLLKTFPEVQFVITTHSPQILSTVPDESIRILSEGRFYSSPKGTKGAEASRLLEQVFGASLRPEQDENVLALKAYEALVYADQWGADEALELRSKLNSAFSGEEPKLTELDLYIEGRLWELSIEED